MKINGKEQFMQKTICLINMLAHACIFSISTVEFTTPWNFRALINSTLYFLHQKSGSRAASFHR
jgi:hypothetical protein